MMAQALEDLRKELDIDGMQYVCIDVYVLCIGYCVPLLIILLLYCNVLYINTLTL